MAWLDPSFNMLICGITNCGKTDYALELLSTVYKGKFDYIVIFFSTFRYNTTYNKSFIFKDDDVFVLIPLDNLDELLEFAITQFIKIGKNIFFLIDDCANLNDTKRKSTALTKLAFSGRHMGISTWLITQKYNAVVKDYRDNIGMLVLYYNKDDKSMINAVDENSIVNKAERDHIIQKLKEYKHSKLVLKLEYPYEYNVLGDSM